MPLSWVAAVAHKLISGPQLHLHPEHAEKHFTASDTVRDVVVGMSDGLTVPFALAAGISGAIAVSHLVVTAGLAEIAAGSIAMGLGGYLAGRSEAEHYASERKREETEVKSVPEVEQREVEQIFESYGLNPEESASVIAALAKRPQQWVDFMMRFELGLEKPDPRRALVSAATIGGSYALGGIIPLAPYIAINDAHTALIVSAVVTLAALGIFGFVKGRFTGAVPIVSAAQTVVIGGIAASAAFLLARAIS
ncbi:MAG TPA: VIT1/CCC1 transporter family protein [Candidatus Dormibacteraeota bacterium]|nr:VIT1/CCC1 transporter family protein [Candidatus Dormibacteraeota bacterium]